MSDEWHDDKLPIPMFARDHALLEELRGLDAEIAQNPNNPELLNRRAVVLSCMWRFDEAIETMSRLISLEPDNPHHYYLRHLYRSDDDLPGKIDDLSRAIHLASDYLEAYSVRSLLHTFMGNYTAALADIDQMLRIEPQNEAILLSRAILRAYQIKDAEGALTDYNRLLAINPNKVIYYVGRANVFKALGENTQAEQDRRRARKLAANSRHSEKHANHGNSDRRH